MDPVNVAAKFKVPEIIGGIQKIWQTLQFIVTTVNENQLIFTARQHSLLCRALY